MNVSFVRNTIARTSEQLRGPLINSASYLIALQIAVSFFGFFFWAIAARLFPSDQVGLATTIFSMTMLLGSFAHLGLPTSLVYYLPRSQKPNRLINACFSVPVLAATVLATIFIAGLAFWSPALLILQSSAFYIFLFILGTITISLTKVQEVLFVSERVSKLSFYNGLLTNLLKFPLLFLALFVANWSIIFAAIIFASLIGFIVYSWYYQRTVRPDFKPGIVLTPKVWRPLAGYSLGNFIADRISLLPDSLIPIIVLNYLGASASAYFFMAWSIAGTLSIAGRALALALFVENSHDVGETKKNVFRSLMFAALILVPGILGVVLFGQPLLSLLGKEYGREGATLLNLLAFSSIPLTVYRIGSSVLRGHNKIRELILVTFVSSALNIGFSLWFIPTLALNGIGVARLAATTLTALVIAWVAFPDAIRRQLSKLTGRGHGQA